MKILQCPYCGNDAIDRIELTFLFFILNKKKKCKHCMKDIKINIENYFAFFLGGGFMLMLSIFFYYYIVAPPCKIVMKIIHINPLSCEYLVLAFAIGVVSVYFVLIFKFLKIFEENGANLE